MMNYPFIICFFLGFLFGSLILLVISLIITAKNKSFQQQVYDEFKAAWEEHELSVTSVSPVSEQSNNTDNNNNK